MPLTQHPYPPPVVQPIPSRERLAAPQSEILHRERWSPPFNDRSIPPQSPRHPNIHVELDMLTNAESTATPTPRRHLCTQTYRRPAAARRYRLLSHPHSLTTAKDSSPANALVTPNNDDKSYCLCGNLSCEEIIGCNRPVARRSHSIPRVWRPIRRKNLRVLIFASLSIQ